MLKVQLELGTLHSSWPQLGQLGDSREMRRAATLLAIQPLLHMNDLHSSHSTAPVSQCKPTASAFLWLECGQNSTSLGTIWFHFGLVCHCPIQYGGGGWKDAVSLLLVNGAHIQLSPFYP